LGATKEAGQRGQGRGQGLGGGGGENEKKVQKRAFLKKDTGPVAKSSGRSLQTTAKRKCVREGVEGFKRHKRGMGKNGCHLDRQTGLCELHLCTPAQKEVSWGAGQAGPRLGGFGTKGFPLPKPR